MAFDQATRNRLQRFVTDVRRILEEEFTRQLQNDLGMDPVSGEVTPIENLTHINDSQRETARIMRDTVAHYCASPGTDVRSALDRIVREQAFTVLNRLAALRMAETRDLLIESVGNGYQAKGFQLYARLAGAGLGETGDAYRTYLRSVFDELSADLPGLFDRFSPQGRLFPREAALMQVLAQINDGEIEPLWTEDETIGWIYQYFNSKEERRAMRDASQAPRNSRELAVRNQFFTPRYVVEFLVDNTLGRLWFDWTGGQTALRDRCQYLLVKPDEQPEAASLLRDPRTIKLLDPACGSMHFGLYAFDLFQAIYREAWDWEQAHGPNMMDRETGGSLGLKALTETYADQASLLRDVPRLIIEHNIYGVDIDPRAAQIASLALWLRAQRAWHEAGVKAKERPQVGQGHVVAAVAPPAEVDLRNQFMEDLDPLDAELFEQTLFMLKGLPELGVLLQVEKELPALIRKVFGEHGPMFSKEDMAQWRKAETRLRKALTHYVRAARSTYQGRLFAEDALQGLRMIDLCREKFDAVVMNPPFGACSTGTREYIEKRYKRSKSDLLSVFAERASQLLNKTGFIGCISSRTAFFLTSFSEWREDFLNNDANAFIFADLGQKVLDAAMVETAAYCLSKEHVEECVFIGALDTIDKESAVRTSLSKIKNGASDRRIFKIDTKEFSKIPGSPYSYWLPEIIRNLFIELPGFESGDVHLRVTNPTADNFRYLRNYWECKSDKIGRRTGEATWVPYAKGGSSTKFYYDVNLVVDWNDASQTYRGYQGTIHRPDIRPASLDFFFRPGIMWPLRASRLCAQVFPSGTIFSARSQCLFAPQSELPYILGLMNSAALDYLFKAALGRSDFPEFVVGVLRKLPRPNASQEVRERIGAVALAASSLMQQIAGTSETDHGFVCPNLLTHAGSSASQEIVDELSRLQEELDQLGWLAYGISPDLAQQALAVAAGVGAVADQEASADSEDLEVGAAALNEHERWLSWAVGVAFGRFDLRYATGEKDAPSPPNPFNPLPAQSPGALRDDSQSFCSHSGILVDDPGHEYDLAGKVDAVLLAVGRPSAEDARRWLQRNFFTLHLSQYSRSGRKAPIYWPISTNSGSYTLWLYYPDLTSQTLYSAVNDFVGPKLTQVSRDAATLRDKGSSRSRDDEKAFEALQAHELELIELRDTLLKIAPTYRPNHDDGVQITAAPLWQLFRHKPWQKLLKDTWAKLEKGEYDWSHLAMAYWPDRVREKCKTDKSLAIAHDVEHLYVEPEPKPAKAGGRKKRSGA